MEVVIVQFLLAALAAIFLIALIRSMDTRPRRLPRALRGTRIVWKGRPW